MKQIIKYSVLYFTILSLFTLSCKEEIDIETISDFEKLLVIQATITDEFKFQEINLSSTYGLNEEYATAISNADVEIIDDNQNTINFYENNISGKYMSSVKFALQPNVIYTLHITTSNGSSYESNPTMLPNSTQIDDINVSREINGLGVEGVSIAVNSFNPSGDSRYYRYEYEETYKIIAPYWNQYDLYAESDFPFTISKVLKSQEERICYKTDYSNHILQKETNGLAEDKVSNFIVRFIPNYNPIITHRYSILVKQYVQTYEAFSYFQTLDKLTGSDNIFSQSQPGFISGNVFKVDNTSEKVIGFFETSAVSIKRVYFNYIDLFEGEASPPYFTDCETIDPWNTPTGPGEPSALVNTIHRGEYIYYAINPAYPADPPMTVGPNLLVPRACGDCTQLGSNIKPDFWED